MGYSGLNGYLQTLNPLFAPRKILFDHQQGIAVHVDQRMPHDRHPA